MEYLVGRNYLKLTVGELSSREYVSIMINDKTFENLKYAGTLSIAECTGDYGVFTYFRFNPAYRESMMDNWIFTDDAATLLAHVRDMQVYIVVDDIGQPVLVAKDMCEMASTEDDFEKLKLLLVNRN